MFKVMMPETPCDRKVGPLRDVPLDAQVDRGLILATSALQVALYQFTGDQLERHVSREIARRVVVEYLRGIDGEATR